MLLSTEHKGTTIHLLKAGAKPVAANKKRKRFEVWDPTKHHPQVVVPVNKGDAQMRDEHANPGSAGSNAAGQQQTRRQQQRQQQAEQK